MSKVGLKINSLSVEIRDVQVFDDVSISFQGGEIVLIEGNNGTGKSTFLKTILGLEKGNRKISSGSVIWNETNDVLKMNEKELLELRSKIAYLEQKDNYEGLTGVTVGEIFQDSLEAYKGRLTKEDNDYIASVFEKYRPEGANFSLKSKISKLSGGQQRMVSIIASLCMRKDAEVFILDEPLNNLDIGSVVHISNLLNRIRFENPQALFLIVSHCKIFPFITRVVRIEDCKMAENAEAGTCYACFGKADEDGYY